MEATGIAAEIGAQRRLQRRARPRSGSPKLIVGFVARIAIIGTVIANNIRTIAI